MIKMCIPTSCYACKFFLIITIDINGKSFEIIRCTKDKNCPSHAIADLHKLSDMTFKGKIP